MTSVRFPRRVVVINEVLRMSTSKQSWLPEKDRRDPDIGYCSPRGREASDNGFRLPTGTESPRPEEKSDVDVLNSISIGILRMRNWGQERFCPE